jgi:hypothetical protein
VDFSTLQTQVASPLRLSLTNTDQAALVKRYINEALQEIHGRYDWPWSVDREVVQTVVDKTDGTVDIGAGATAVAGTSTAFTASDVGSFIQFSSSDDWYKITAVTDAENLTIEAAYTGTSALDDGTYTIRKLFYACASTTEKILSIKQALSPRKVALAPLRMLEQMVPFSEDTGDALLYALHNINSSGLVQFMLFPHPDEVLNLELRVKKKLTELSASTDEPLIPSKWQWAIVEGALERGFRYIAGGQSGTSPTPGLTLSRDARGKFEQYIAAMIADAEPESDGLPQIRSSEVSFGAGARGPYLPDDFNARQR